MKILATGGAGFIGSHTVVELINAGHEVVIVDNLSNSSSIVLQRIEQICGTKPLFYQVDIREKDKLCEIMHQHKFDAVIHFAGLKAVGESVEKPFLYYDNNINGTLCLLDAMRQSGCKKLIFSSSATVYGNNPNVPFTESTPKAPCTNPYGWTKSMIEQILMDMQKANNEFNIILLRYFNPIGAHKSGKIGENPNGRPNNLMPYLTKVAIGEYDKLHVYGNDYNTPDGTAMRDYIHVVDLAKGHVKALNAVNENCGLKIYNLGTGQGSSVLDVIKAFEQANNIKIPYQIEARRSGDVEACWADSSKANKELGWKAQYDLIDMCRDSWNWQKNNPHGYE